MSEILSKWESQKRYYDDDNDNQDRLSHNHKTMTTNPNNILDNLFATRLQNKFSLNILDTCVNIRTP